MGGIATAATFFLTATTSVTNVEAIDTTMTTTCRARALDEKVETCTTKSELCRGGHRSLDDRNISMNGESAVSFLLILSLSLFHPVRSAHPLFFCD